MSPVRLHSSNPNLCAELVDFQPPVSRLTDSGECASDYIKLQEEFCTIAQKGRQADGRAEHMTASSGAIRRDIKILKDYSVFFTVVLPFVSIGYDMICL